MTGVASALIRCVLLVPLLARRLLAGVLPAIVAIIVVPALSAIVIIVAIIPVAVRGRRVE